MHATKQGNGIYVMHVNDNVKPVCKSLISYHSQLLIYDTIIVLLTATQILYITLK